MSTKPKASKQPATRVAQTSPLKKRTRKSAAPVPSIAPTGTKQSRLIAMLQDSSGCSIAQMTDLTGWQPHTVRGVISGVLRKKLGLNVVCEGGASGNLYKIAPAAR